MSSEENSSRHDVVWFVGGGYFWGSIATKFFDRNSTAPVWIALAGGALTLVFFVGMRRREQRKRRTP